jgi:hypothetical protein
MSNNPRITAAERRENERIKSERKQPREEWVAFIVNDEGEKKYLANPAHTQREFTTERSSAKRFPAEAEANAAATAARWQKRLRPPKGGSQEGALFWESVPRRWITQVGVERVR